jgi:hypothetical protein
MFVNMASQKHPNFFSGNMSELFVGMQCDRAHKQACDFTLSS